MYLNELVCRLEKIELLSFSWLSNWQDVLGEVTPWWLSMSLCEIDF